MNVINFNKVDIGEPKEKFIQKSDTVPEFWQFLNGLYRDDIITELIQNELDAHSEHTKIDFHEYGFTCSGNGDKIDSDGWKRLSFLKGAGDEAPQKKCLTGVKNHGIKTYFTVGDKITIRSGSLRTVQTLYRYGTTQPPSPGAYPSPVNDPTAPAEGCMIEVVYRTIKLVPPVGEHFEFDPPTAADIEQLFTDACQDIQDRFIGALAPGRREKYTLELTHYRLGTITFHFKCSPPRKTHHTKKNQRLVIYRRECSVTQHCSSDMILNKIIEDCHRFVLPKRAESNIDIQEFYAVGDGEFCTEISWRTTGRRPYKTSGRKRYPIAYSSGIQHAMTQMGLHTSAPYVSDLERHRPSENNSHNAYIDQCCRKKLVELLRDYFLPAFGPSSLELLYDSETADTAPLREMINLLLEYRAVPLYQPLKGRRKTKTAGKLGIKLGPLLPKKGRQSKVLLPSFTWGTKKIETALINVCPMGESIIHPDIPSNILCAWADDSDDALSQNEKFAFFDEINALQRWVSHDYEAIPWDDQAQWQSEIGDWQRVRCYLDILNTALDNESMYFDPSDYDCLKKNVMLPAKEGPPRPIGELYSGSDLPVSLKLKDIPPFIHDKLSGHAIFDRKKWKIPQFTLSDFIDQLESSQLADIGKNSLWLWLIQHSCEVPSTLWSRLSKLSIWKDKEGGFRQLSELCQPESKAVSKILSRVLLFPDDKIHQIEAVSRGDGKVLIRNQPSVAEISLFLHAQTEDLPKDTVLSKSDIARFRTFEQRLSTLAKDDTVSQRLPKSNVTPIALNKTGQLKPVSALVQDNSANAQLSLNAEVVIDRRAAPALQALNGWAANLKATSGQVLAALKESPDNTGALESRLRAYVQACRKENRDIITGISSLRCIPIDGELYAPEQLVLSQYTRHNFFGEWKKALPSKAMNSATQELYRCVGVLANVPAIDSTRGFFEWLSKQIFSVIHKHLNHIIRLIDHEHGPTAWYRDYPNLPFIPVKTRGRVELVSQAQLTIQKEKVFIPDFEALESIISESSIYADFKLVIVSIKEFKTPIKEAIQAMGGRCLKESAGNPIEMKPIGDVAVDKELSKILSILTSPKMERELKKRLAGFDIPMKVIRTNWAGRLRNLNEVYVADSLHATYKLYRHRPSCDIPHVIMEQDAKVWLARNGKDCRMLFYEAIADQVFDHPNKSHPVVLKEAVERDFKEETREDAFNDDSDEKESKKRKTHPKSGGGDNKPDPKHPIRDSGKTDEGQDHSSKKNATSARSKSKSEKKQIKILKEKQYALNCQACLTGSPPNKLAPQGSYAYQPENRKLLIEAHHPHPVHDGGARHAGNILILCHYHHGKLGNLLSRKSIITALRENCRPHKLTFSDNGSSIEIEGKIIDIPLSTIDPLTSLFFTQQHYELWLEA
jgi:hypothetical protein